MSTFLAAVLAGFLACASFVARAAEVYAHIEFLEGGVTVIDANGVIRPARVGDDVLVGETIVTGAQGELHARTADYGLVALRPNTRLRIEAFHAAGGDDDTSLVSLVKGSLRSITGWIGKHRPHAYSIHTPNATIGIRGTDHEPLYLESPTDGAAAGTYEKVNSGATFVEAQGKRIEVPAGGAAHVPHGQAPRLLDHVPEVYKPARNDARIAQRKAELEREMEVMRAKAQQAAQERRNAPQGQSGEAAQKAEGKSSAAGGAGAGAAAGEGGSTEKAAAEPSAAAKAEDKPGAGKADDKPDEHRRERHHRHTPPH